MSRATYSTGEQGEKIRIGISGWKYCPWAESQNKGKRLSSVSLEKFAKVLFAQTKFMERESVASRNFKTLFKGVKNMYAHVETEEMGRRNPRVKH